MMLRAFILLLAGVVSGVVMVDLKHCQHLLPSGRIPQSPIPDKQELVSLCPAIMQYLECLSQEMEADDTASFEEYNRSIYENIEDILRDLCTEGSEMQADYLASVDCFRDVKDKFDSCLKHAHNVYREYRVASLANISNFERADDESDCFSRGHAVGCMSTEILHTCGSFQKSVYVQLVQRSRYLANYCDETTVEDLRNNYLNYLNLDEELQNIYSAVLYYDMY